MNIIKPRRALALILSLLTIFVITGCSTQSVKKNEKYVASVKSIVNDVVNLNRVLKEQNEEFNCHDPVSSEQLAETMDKLTDRFENILKLQAEKEFKTYDSELKEKAGEGLKIMTEYRMLVKYSEEKLDDKFYKNEKEELDKKYVDICADMRNLSSEIQTYWRNA